MKQGPTRNETQPEDAVDAPNGAVDDTATADDPARKTNDGDKAPKEVGGREGPDPTRYGDWEKAGRCIDF